MALPEYLYITVHRFRNGVLTETDHPFSTEYPVMITLNGNPFMTIACSGNSMENLVTGILLSERIISSADDIYGIEFDEKELLCAVACKTTSPRYAPPPPGRTRYTSGGRSVRDLPGGSIISAAPPEIMARVIIHSMEQFLRKSAVHELTRGVHSSALIDVTGREIIFFDEIGRHNAIDKVLGYAANNAVDTSGLILLTTGRISSEIIVKCVYGGVRALVSRAAPTSYGVELARRYTMVTVTHVKDDEFLVVSNPGRIEA